jgi:hypothetical protein
MDADEKDICTFLKSFPGEYVALREICRKAGGKWRFKENDNWAAPVLLRLVELGLVEDDSAGHFRLIVKAKKKQKTKWVAPHIKEILKKSGKTFDLESEDPD